LNQIISFVQPKTSRHPSKKEGVKIKTAISFVRIHLLQKYEYDVDRKNIFKKT